MTYTPEHLAEMSDHEINLAVAEKLSLEHFILHDEVRAYHFFGEIKCHNAFSPCSNWNNVMPIAERYAISVKFPSFYREIPEARKYIHKKDCYLSCNNQNPKRAICEVFLMMDIGE